VVDVICFFSYILRLGMVRGVRLGLTLVWNSILWAIWSLRNDYIYAEGLFLSRL